MKTLILLTIGVIDSVENNTASVEFHDFNDGSVQRALLNVDDFPCDAEETDFFYIAIDDGEFVIYCGQPEMR
tara:strand:+ start:226 stop:441 length:216 start_codon:yes stop_codon:yes gene_type:complete